MLKLLPLCLWPILFLPVQTPAQQASTPLTQAPLTPQYTELSTHWDSVGSFDSGFDHIMGIAVFPTSVPDAGRLIIADSSGRIGEWRYADSTWKRVREFSVGETVTGICSGSPYLDHVQRLYIGTRSGKIFEVSRTALGWSTKELTNLDGPIIEIKASDAGSSGISQLMVIGGDSSVTNMWPTEKGQWVAREVPDIPGGATEVCFDYHREGLRAVTAGARGVIYKFTQDSTGSWKGGLWATMPAGALDMAASADPTMKDVAVFYSGTDGIFRYLFYGYTDDKKARIPIAAGVTHIIGKGSQRRFNEFFAVSADQFCMFEFSFTDRAWHKVPLATIKSPIVATVFGPGRGDVLSQMYAASADGRVFEFYRGVVEEK